MCEIHWLLLVRTADPTDFAIVLKFCMGRVYMSEEVKRQLLGEMAAVVVSPVARDD
jgi:hypothetical protein